MSGTYILERTIETQNCIVKVFRPELDESERERRLNTIRTATEKLLKGTV